MLSSGLQTIQGVELQRGRVNLTSGVHKDINSFSCVEDGTLVITWNDGTTDAVDFVAGDRYSLNVKSVEITSGVFHLSRI